jgi:anti-sigma regulatory factor (Ser/Thr protein kinase)
MDPIRAAVADVVTPPRKLKPPTRTAAAPSPLFGFPVVTETYGAVRTSARAVREAVRRYCSEYSITGEACDTAQSVAVELATNAVVHSGSPDFVLDLRIASTLHGPVLHIEVADRGRWPDDDADPDRDQDEQGRGWQMVQGMAITCGVASEDSVGTRAWAHVKVGIVRPAVA